MSITHQYRLSLKWVGSHGAGPVSYSTYSRAHVISGDGKSASIEGSSDPSFRGEPDRYNPEELLVAALSACHMLWMLHLCADARIVVLGYTDAPVGTMIEYEDGSGEFTSVTLQPHLILQDLRRKDELPQLHTRAHSLCFIARSVNFPVTHVSSAVAENVLN
jgi:organic hydroperoxide reductase OsmC/OhrA